MLGYFADEVLVGKNFIIVDEDGRAIKQASEGADFVKSGGVVEEDLFIIKSPTARPQ